MYKASLLSTALGLTLVSCVSYREQPLIQKEIFEELSKSQNEFIKTNKTDLSFAQAEALMSKNNLEVAELKSLYDQSEALAKISTPLPNPELNAGPEFGSNLGDTSASSTQPFISLAFTIPLNGRLGIEDDLNQIAKEQSNVELILKHRELSLNLRQSYLAAILTQQKIHAQNSKDQWLKKQVKNVEQGLRAGLYSSMDAGRIYSQAIEQESQALTLKEEALEVKFQLSKLLNRDIPELAALQLDSEKSLVNFSKLPSYDELKKMLMANSPELKRLELEYRYAEKALKLEVRKQYPDLKIGTDWAQEVGEEKETFSLGIGFELPIFDRNQRAITRADHKRKILRRRYERISAELLLKLRKSLKVTDLKQKMLKLYRENLLVNSEKNFREAKLAVEAGTIDLQRYWDFQEQLLNIRYSKTIVVENYYRSLCELESLIGQSLATAKPSLPTAKK